jgi:AcrR family transcriptional regulator
MSTWNRSGRIDGIAVARPYHHGNLRAALIEAGVELAREGGPDAVVLREACRRVGVSHNAAYRHFPDRDALLKAVAADAMSALARLIEQRVEAVRAPNERARSRAALEATGRAYVEFALSEPGLFRTAFSVPEHEEPLATGEGVGDSGLGPFGLLGRGLDDLLAAGVLSPERRPGAEYTAWSGVHGVSMLLLDGPLRALAADVREAVIERVLADIGRGVSGV